jgi:hypothetical protein
VQDLLAPMLVRQHELDLDLIYQSIRFAIAISSTSSSASTSSIT